MSLPNIDAGRAESRYSNVPSVSCGFARSSDLLKRHFPDLVVSKQKLRRADAIACVRLKRQEANQNLGFASRLRIPGDGDERSEVMAITIPK